MELDFTTVLNFIGMTIVVPVVWVLRMLLRDMRSLEHEMAEHKRFVAITYVEKDDLRYELQEIKDSIKEISATLRSM